MNTILQMQKLQTHANFSRTAECREVMKLFFFINQRLQGST